MVSKKKPKIKLVRSKPTAGDQFKEAVLEVYDLLDFEITQLEQACLLLDRAEQAAELLDRDGLILTGPRGASAAHPLLRVERQSRIAFIQAVKALHLDIEGPLGRADGAWR